MKLTLFRGRKHLFLKLYIALLFASFTCFPYEFVSKAEKFLCFGIAAIGWFLLTCLALRLFRPLRDWSAAQSDRIASYLGRIPSRRLFFLFWAVISLLWLPAYLALFPGTFGYDAPIQWNQYIGRLPMTDHHPVVHTWLLGSLISFGHALFGSYNAGVALYTAFQGLCVSASLSYLLLTLHRRNIHALYVPVTLLWFGCNPYLQVLAFSCTKDILFGACFADFLVTLYRLYYDEKEKAGRRDIVLLSVFGLLSCLLRHQGVYILAVLLLFTAFYKCHRRAILISLFSVLVITELFGYCCHNLLGFKASDPREMLSVPMQQMASVCKDKLLGGTAKVTDRQLATVETFLPEEGILNYTASSADPVKYTFVTDAFFEDFGTNLSTYFALGIQNVHSYVVAFKRMTAPYFKAEEYTVRGLMTEYSFLDRYTENFRHHSLFPTYDRYLVKTTTNPQYTILPGASLLFNPNLGVWLAFAALGIAIQKRNRKKFLLLLPILLYFATLLLGPVALIRYVYPLLLLTPFIAFLMVAEESN